MLTPRRWGGAKGEQLQGGARGEQLQSGTAEREEESPGSVISQELGKRVVSSGSEQRCGGQQSHLDREELVQGIREGILEADMALRELSPYKGRCRGHAAVGGRGNSGENVLAAYQETPHSHPLGRLHEKRGGPHRT